MIAIVNVLLLTGTSGINPNGVGMGGQVKSFAFFLDASLDEGHSYPSATFNNLELHATGKEEAAASFDLDVVEIWCPNHVLQLSRVFYYQAKTLPPPFFFFSQRSEKTREKAIEASK